MSKNLGPTTFLHVPSGKNIALSIKLETNSVTFSHVVKKLIFVSIFTKKSLKSFQKFFKKLFFKKTIMPKVCAVSSCNKKEKKIKKGSKNANKETKTKVAFHR